MSDGFPSMTALLGLLAVAGFQNRDKIAEMLGRGAQMAAPGQGASPGGLGGVLGSLSGGGGASAGGLLSGGLGELIDRFKQSGHGDVASSWVNHGPNQAIAPPQLEQAIGSDVIDTLMQRTGLSREELLKKLSTLLPTAVDQYTPGGRIPAAS